MPLPKVRGIAEEEMFKVVKTGKKTAKKGTSYLLSSGVRSATRLPTEICMGTKIPLEYQRKFVWGTKMPSNPLESRLSGNRGLSRAIAWLNKL